MQDQLGIKIIGWFAGRKGRSSAARHRLSSLSHHADGWLKGRPCRVTPLPAFPSWTLQLTGRVLKLTRREEGHPLPWSWEGRGGQDHPASTHGILAAGLLKVLT